MLNHDRRKETALLLENANQGNNLLLNTVVLV